MVWVGARGGRDEQKLSGGAIPIGMHNNPAYTGRVQQYAAGMYKVGGTGSAAGVYGDDVYADGAGGTVYELGRAHV